MYRMLPFQWLQVTQIPRSQYLSTSNKCFGDDTKAAARQSPNCIRKTKKIGSVERGYSVKKNCFTTQNLTEIWQSAAELCIRLPNFVQSGPSSAEIMMLNWLSRWRPLRRNFTSGFGFADVAVFRRSVSISTPNFVVIAQSTAEI